MAVEAPVLLKNIAFSATVTIEMKTMPSYPFIKLLSISFPEMPEVEFSLKPLKGMDLMDVPGLSASLNKLISDILAMMFVPPNIYTLDLDAMMNGTGYALESSIGVLMVRVYEAKELKNMDQLGGTSDPYVAIKLGGRLLAESQVIHNNLNPYWDESFYILVQSFNDVLELTVQDKDVLKNRTMGLFKSSLKELGLDIVDSSAASSSSSDHGRYRLEDLWRPLRGSNDKSRGQIRFDLAFFPIATGSSPDTASASSPSSAKRSSKVPSCGILHVTIHQAKELDESKSIVGLYNPYIEVRHNGQLAHKTKIKKRTNNPTFEDNFELFIRNVDKGRLHFTVMDQRDLSASRPEIGNCEVSVAEVIKMSQPGDATVKKIEWWTLRNANSGKLRLSFRFFPIMIDHDVPDDSSSQSSAAVGVVRVNIIEASNLKNQQAVGISDPYVMVIYTGKCRVRTAVQPATLQPVWNEPHYILVGGMKGRLGFELFDFNNLQKDKFMGRCDIDLKWMLAECSDKAVKTVLPIYLDSQKKQHGSLTVELSYYPLPEERKLTGWSQLVANSSSPKTRQLGSAGVLSSDSTPALFGPAEPVKKPEKQKPEEEVHEDEEMVSGILHLELEEIALEEAAMLEEGYDGKRKRPSPYLEFFDCSGCMHSNYAAELSGTNLFERTEEKAAVLNPSSLTQLVRRRTSRELSAIKNSLTVSVDNDGGPLKQSLVLMYRSSSVKKSTTGAMTAKLELFVKDLQSARMLVICKDAKADDSATEGAAKDRILGKTQLSMRDLLDEPSEWFRLFPVRVNASVLLTGRFRMNARFTPIDIDEDLLVNEQELLATSCGKVEMCLIEANNLPAVDSSGTSDPYCIVRLNNERVHKTKVLKKNMNPKWNDSLTIHLTNRASSRLFVEIKDWNQFEDHKTLGYVALDCARMAVDERIELKYQLADEDGVQVVDKNGQPATLQLRTQFIPDVTETYRKRQLARRRKNQQSKNGSGSTPDIATAIVAAKRLKTNAAIRSLSRSPRSPPDQSTSESDETGKEANSGHDSRMPAIIAEADIEGSMQNLPRLLSGTLDVTIIEAKNCPAKADVYLKLHKVTDPSTHMRRASSSKSVNRLSTMFKHGLADGSLVHRTEQLRVPSETGRVAWNEQVLIPFTLHEGEQLEYSMQLKSHNIIGPATELAVFTLNIWQIVKAKETAGSFDFWLLPSSFDANSSSNNHENISLHLAVEYQPVIN